MGKPKLKSVRSPQRELLAEAIAAHEQAKAWAQHVRKAVEANFEKRVAASRAIDQAKADAAAAEKDAPSHLVAHALGQRSDEPMPLAEAQAAAARAEAWHAKLMEIDEGLQRELVPAQHSVGHAQTRVREAIATVLKSDASITRLMNDYEATLATLVEQRQALDFIDTLGALSKELDRRAVPGLVANRVSTIIPSRWDDIAGDLPWRKYVERLEKDPDAELPN
jgi:hypothetical protein